MTGPARRGLDDAIRAALAEADALPGPFERLAATREVIDALRAWSGTDGAVQRTRIVRELSAQGWSYRAIAQEAGVSPARVQQWIDGEQ